MCMYETHWCYEINNVTIYQFFFMMIPKINKSSFNCLFCSHCISSLINQSVPIDPDFLWLAKTDKSPPITECGLRVPFLSALITNERVVARQTQTRRRRHGNMVEMSSGITSYHRKHQIERQSSPFSPHSLFLPLTHRYIHIDTHTTNVSSSGTSLVKVCWVSWCFCRVLLAPRCSAPSVDYVLLLLQLLVSCCPLCWKCHQL